jgi:hypothetical protein
MTAIGLSIDQMVEMKRRSSREKNLQWWNDPHLFNQASLIVASFFEMFRPQTESSLENLDTDAQAARFTIEATLREIQIADPTIPFAEQTTHQRRLNFLKQTLGPLADRPVIWGKSADRARAERDAISSGLRQELIALSRKEGKTPEAMTAAETTRLRELEADLIAKIVKLGSAKS